MSVTLDALAKHAEEIRKELNVPDQERLFRVATEAGYLTALADEKVDADERASMIKAIEALSKGSVIEWELDAFIDDCEKRAKEDGKKARLANVGDNLSKLGQPEAALLFAAFIAQASGGIDKKEATIVHALGKAAGVAKDKVTAILTRVGAAATDG
jgi:tellurite resistance protein